MAVFTDDQPVFVARDQAIRFAAKCDRPVFAVGSARLVPNGTLQEVEAIWSNKEQVQRPVAEYLAKLADADQALHRDQRRTRQSTCP